jgi:NADH:ubiquinone oxidoreductase subunit E
MIDNQIDEILVGYQQGRQEYLIPILQNIQNVVGYIPEIAVKKVASYLGISSSTIYGVTSFYNQFRYSPRGKYHIQLCYGTACYLFGASTLLNELEGMLQIREGEVSEDGLFSLELLDCIGGCGKAPVIAINGEYYGNISLIRLNEIIQEIKVKEKA